MLGRPRQAGADVSPDGLGLWEVAGICGAGVRIAIGTGHDRKPRLPEALRESARSAEEVD